MCAAYDSWKSPLRRSSPDREPSPSSSERNCKMAEASHRGRPGCECAERLLGEYDEFILFDTETTGFSPASCALI